MERQGKVWGATSPLFCKNNVEVHRIEGVKGGYCSIHSHIKKFNQFFIESGSMLVSIWRQDQVDEVILRPGETCTVKPGEKHRFEILERGTVAFEIYWTEIEPEDIVREAPGGIRRR